MKIHSAFLKPVHLAAVMAALAVLGLLALTGSSASAAAAKPVSHECQHPLVTGEEAVNVKGVSVGEACKVVRALGKYLSKPANIRKLYECAGATRKMPGRPVLLMSEFEGWKLKLVGYNFVMYKAGASFRVTGTDFPVNCS
jgi:hypothetical protein